MTKPKDTTKSIILNLPHTIQFLVLAVRDIYKSAEDLSSKLGVGPWQIREFPQIERGDAIFGETYKYLYGSTKLGSIILELEQPLSGNSPTTQFINTHGEGIYAVGYVVQDLDRALSQFNQGVGKIIRSGKTEGCRFYTVQVDPNLIIEFQEAQAGDVMIL